MKQLALGFLLSLTACRTMNPESSPSVARLVRPDQENWLKGSVTSSDGVSRLVVFGDSLSDTGRLNARTRFLYPPDVYWRSRASNGPIWIDYVSQALERNTRNYAVAGAATGSTSWFRDAVIPSLQEQIASYHDETEENHRRKDLAVLWIGPNNYLADLDKGNVTEAIKDLEAALQQLRKGGVKTFVIGTMPELGGLPAYQKAEAADKRLRAFTVAHKKALKEWMQKSKRQDQDETLLSFHANEINQETIDRPTDFGFRNVVEACYKGDFLGRFKDKEEFCQDPSGYKFWDEVHPNSKMHCYYAVQFLSDLQDAGMIRGYQKREALQQCRKL